MSNEVGSVLPQCLPNRRPKNQNQVVTIWVPFYSFKVFVQIYLFIFLVFVNCIPAIDTKPQSVAKALPYLRHCILWFPHSQQNSLDWAAGWSLHSWEWGSVLWAPQGTTHSWNCQDNLILESQGYGLHPSDLCRYRHMFLWGIWEKKISIRPFGMIKIMILILL